MQSEQKQYIKLSKNILKNTDLKSNDKLIYSLIDNFTHLKGYCWASNEIIAKELNLSNKTVQCSINKLIKLKFLFKWKKKKGTMVYRILTTNESLIENNNDIKEIIENPKIELLDYNWLEEL